MNTNQVFEQLLSAVAPPDGGQYTTHDLQPGKQLHVGVGYNNTTLMATGLCVTFWRMAYARELAPEYKWRPHDFERLMLAIEREQRITPRSNLKGHSEISALVNGATDDSMTIAINVLHSWKLAAERTGDNTTRDSDATE